MNALNLALRSDHPVVIDAVDNLIAMVTLAHGDDLAYLREFRAKLEPGKDFQS